jgi:DNA-binding FrmR family transcriptional regulator
VLSLVVKAGLNRGARHCAKVLAGFEAVSSAVDEVANEPADEVGTFV